MPAGSHRPRLFDAHLHLSFMSNACEVARQAAAEGLVLYAATVTPADYRNALVTLEGEPNVRLALGLHPWWVADGRCGEDDLQRFEDLATRTRWVGEVGLDFSDAHTPTDSHDQQAAAFARACTAAAAHSHDEAPTVLSIHAVRSADACLDILSQTGCLERCRCVFHWFSGSSDELHRAVASGCWFSVNEMMLATRRGREYARQLPLERLLTETDLPPHEGEPFEETQVRASLERSCALMAQARHVSPDELREAIATNAQRLLA